MLRRCMRASVFLVLGACDTATPPQESRPASNATTPATIAPLRYQPTLDAHRPERSLMELLAEAGDVAKGRLLLVVAHHDGTTLSVDVWAFESTEDDGTLVPKAPPTRLLALSSEEAVDVDALNDFVRTRAAGHSASARPQGIAAEGAPAALERLHANAVAARDETATPAARVTALAAFTRGLDDDLLFSRRGLAAALTSMAKDGLAAVEGGSSRRADARWGETKISMLRKGDGWTIDALR